MIPAEAVTVPCGWRACTKIIEPFTGSGARRQYCSDQHKRKASAARVRNDRKKSTVGDVREHVVKASGFQFAKIMEASERLAEQHGHDADTVKALMIDALSQRIAVHKAEEES